MLEGIGQSADYLDSRAKYLAAMSAPVGSYNLRPDSRVIERQGWYQIITPSSKSASLNEVLFSELEENSTESVLNRTIEEYRALGLQFKWCVGPWTRPSDLGYRLERRGFTHWDVRGMVCDPQELSLRYPAGIEVEEVTPETSEVYIQTMVRGWDLPSSEIEMIREGISKRITEGHGRIFLARFEGKAVGTAGLIMKPESAYLVGGNVLPEYRGKGIYRALLEFRLAAMRKTPLRLVTTQAREKTSAPILEKLGFETVFRSRCYQSPSPQSTDS